MGLTSVPCQPSLSSHRGDPGRWQLRQAGPAPPPFTGGEWVPERKEAGGQTGGSRLEWGAEECATDSAPGVCEGQGAGSNGALGTDSFCRDSRARRGAGSHQGLKLSVPPFARSITQQVTSSLASGHRDKVQTPHPWAQVVPVVTHRAWRGEVTGPRQIATVTS